jgi:hypothetical protein
MDEAKHLRQPTIKTTDTWLMVTGKETKELDQKLDGFITRSAASEARA